MVDDSTLRNRREKMAYREAVLHDISSFCEILEGHFMTCRNRVLSTYIYTIDVEAGTSFDIMYSDGDIVRRVYPYEIHRL